MLNNTENLQKPGPSPCNCLQDVQPGVPPANDLRFYARGLFASPLVTRIDGSWTSWWATVAAAAYGVNLVVHSLLDYPLRRLSGGR